MVAKGESERPVRRLLEYSSERFGPRGLCRREREESRTAPKPLLGATGRRELPFPGVGREWEAQVEEKVEMSSKWGLLQGSGVSEPDTERPGQAGEAVSFETVLRDQQESKRGVRTELWAVKYLESICYSHCPAC